MNKKTIHGIDLTAADGIQKLMDFHRQTFGTAVMQADVEPPADPAAPVDPPVIEPAEDPDAPDPADEAALGDPGKRALDSMKEKLKQARAALVERDTELATLRKPADPATTPEAIRAEVEAEVRAEANERVLKAEVKVAAAGKFQDADLALSLVNIAEIHVGADGEPDADDIAEALDAVLEKYPYLAAQSGSKKRVPNVTADPAKPDTTPPTLAEQIKSAEASGDWKKAMALKSQQLAGIANK